MTLAQQHFIDRCIFEKANDAFIILQPHELRIVAANPAAERLAGVDSGQLVGAALAEFLESEEGHRSDDLRRACATATAATLSAYFKSQAGGRIPVRVTVGPIPSPVESEPFALIVAHDISEHRRDEQALRDVDERYRSIVEGSLQGILIHQDARICYANPALARMFGYESADELVGRPLWETFAHPDVVPVLQERTVAILAGADIPPHQGWKGLGKDGREVWVATAASRIDWRGRPAVASFYLDITERKRADEERRQLEARVQQAQKLESLSVLAGGIAHDFNNLLTAILGYSSLLRRDLPSDTTTQLMLGEIENAAQRAAELTRQMLAYAGQGRFVIESHCLSAIVKEMAQLLATVTPKGAVLLFETEPARIEADAAHIRQIIMNLVSNAAEALAGAGTIRLRTGLRHADAAALRSRHSQEELPAGEYAFIDVVDNGCGMNAETLARVFEPFFTTKFTGRGLGLAAVLGIVRAHGGVIQVDSEVGVGSTFRVLLPAKTPQC